MWGNATFTTVPSTKATMEPRMAALRVSRFCAAVMGPEATVRKISVRTTEMFGYTCSQRTSTTSKVAHLPKLLLIPLEDTVVFPTMDVTLPVDVGDEERVVLVPRHDGAHAKVGTIANVADRVRLPGGLRGASLEGASRG